MDTLYAILSLIITVLLGVAVYFLKDLPNLYRELKVEEVRATNSMELQREAYFRETTSKDLLKLFNDWLSMLYDTDRKLKNFGRNQAIDLVSRTVMYGSSRTIYLSSLYMQNIFNDKGDVSETNNSETHSEESLSYNTCKTILYVAYIVSSLKFDFTGYETSPINLLEIKINDISTFKETENFKKALADIEKEIKKIKG